ncbi:MAG: aminotransferase class I/II-fold pyridoxal phosphate-dependent enzyme, partial [Candidatus Cloacimonadaceae bacterium]
MYDFDTLIDRRSTGCFKYDGLKQIYGESELLPLWVADMDFAVSPQIQAALARRASHPIFGYNFRLPALQEALVYWQKQRHGWEVKDHHLSVLPSLMTALAYTIMAHTQPGEGILIQSPVYPPFHNSVKEQQRKLLINSLINDNGYYRIDFEDFEAKAREAKLFILCNPHNPVGRVFTQDELQTMAEICQKH